ncbi:MAG: formate dehydrogenase accessory sulfurtransferase FdhD [Candidatus Thorarchaeota archaeon]
MNDLVETIDCTRIRNGSRMIEKEVVATESRLALYVNDKFETQFNYSSGLDECLVYGYLLSSGRISSKSDIDIIEIDSQECKVNLAKEDDPTSDPAGNQKTVSFDMLLEIRDLLVENQQNHRATRGFHGAILYELATNRWFACEDIGRHNAVDKVIGYGLQEDYILSDSVLLLSGRLLSNIVSKGIHAGIPVLASMTVTTSEGIQKAREKNRTLVGSLSDEGCWLYNEGVVKVKTTIQ